MACLPLTSEFYPTRLLIQPADTWHGLICQRVIMSCTSWFQTIIRSIRPTSEPSISLHLRMKCRSGKLFWLLSSSLPCSYFSSPLCSDCFLSNLTFCLFIIFLIFKSYRFIVKILVNIDTLNKYIIFIIELQSRPSFSLHLPVFSAHLSQRKWFLRCFL